MSPADLEGTTALAVVYAVVIYAALFVFARQLIRLRSVSSNLTAAGGRYGSLDGFRGVLAVGVFVHHSFAAYVYFSGGDWQWSKSALLNHLGQTTVALFFMITGFLFALKAMDSRMDWRDFYVARFARLSPLYVVVVLAVFATVWVFSGWQLREPGWVVAKELLTWLSFACFGQPDINGLPQTWMLIAGVNWSLKYEVLFYLFGVPALFLGARIFSPRINFSLAAALLLCLLTYRFFKDQQNGDALHTTHFLCGIVTAYAYGQSKVWSGVRSSTFRAVAASSILLLFFAPNGYGAASIVVALMLFAAVAGGLSMFGLLNTRPALWLGDISYGLYLIHGMVLWFTLFALRKGGYLAGLGLFEYSVVMVAVGAVAVGLASLSYIKLERPAMAFAKRRAHARRLLVGSAVL